MSRIARVFVATAVAATAVFPVAQSYAHDRHFRHHHGNGPGWDRAYQGRRHHHKKPAGRVNNNSDAVLLGVLGLAAGAIIAGALLSDPGPQPYHGKPGRGPDYGPSGGWAGSDYYPPAPVDDYAAGGAIEPWTEEWYRYCAQRYRSFKPATGTFRGYDGHDHFCVAR